MIVQIGARAACDDRRLARRPRVSIRAGMYATIPGPARDPARQTHRLDHATDRAEGSD